MGTESASERFLDIDQWSTENAIEAMFEGQLGAVSAVRRALPQIAAAADAAAERLKSGGRLFYAGAGTSGRIAVQDGVELGPTFNWPTERVDYVLAGGLKATTVSAEGSEDDESEAIDALSARNIGPLDVLIAVAASGRTPYTLSALKEANRQEALTIGVANNIPSALLDEATFSIAADTGSEVVAGSTRMKAGTAQKVILNLLSTAIMIRCGRVYKGRMVDMVISNRKLRARAIGMIEELAGVSREDAEMALVRAKDDIKVGILCALGADVATAGRLLEDSNEDLRVAISALQDRATSVGE